jgi:hypothetical protein
MSPRQSNEGFSEATAGSRQFRHHRSRWHPGDFCDFLIRQTFDLRAISLNSGYATARQWYALQLSVLGRLDEAITEMTMAESSDPLSLIISADLADVLFAAHRYDAEP